MRHAHALVRGQRAEIVGRIGMDQLMIRLPGPFDAGERVTLIGRQGEACIPIAELAAHIDSAAQEITTSLTDRITKIYANAEEVQAPWNNGMTLSQRQAKTVS